jgi:hypothetical protein
MGLGEWAVELGDAHCWAAVFYLAFRNQLENMGNPNGSPKDREI